MSSLLIYTGRWIPPAARPSLGMCVCALCSAVYFVLPVVYQNKGILGIIWTLHSHV